MIEPLSTNDPLIGPLGTDGHLLIEPLGTNGDLFIELPGTNGDLFIGLPGTNGDQLIGLLGTNENLLITAGRHSIKNANNVILHTKTIFTPRSGYTAIASPYT